MKITLQSKSLLEKLQFVSGALSSKTTLPMLENFFFSIISNDKMQITASDLETTITGEIDIKSDIVGSVCVPAKMLIEVLKSFADQPLEFTFNENQNELNIKSQTGEYQLACYPGVEYPSVTHFNSDEKAVIGSDVLAEAISKTLFATGNDDLRPIMNGILIELSKDGAVFVSTDAHRLVKYTRSDVTITNPTEAVIPKKTMSLLKSIIGSGEACDVQISFTNINASFEYKNFTITCRLVDGKYPNYNAVIPKENPNVLIIDRAKLLKSVKCVDIFSDRNTHQIAFKIKGNELNLSSTDPNYSSSAHEVLPCNYDGQDMTIGFNARFVIDALSNISCDEVKLELSDPKRAGILIPNDGLEDSEGLLVLVMPVMLK